MFTFVENSLIGAIAHVVLLFPLLLYAINTLRNYGRGKRQSSAWYLLGIPLLLLPREFLAVLVIDSHWQQFLLRTLSFLLVAIYLGWFASFLRSRGTLISYCAFFVAVTVLGVLAGFEFVSLRLYAVISNVFMGASFLYLFIQSYVAVSSGRSLEVRKIRTPFFCGLAITIVLYFIPQSLLGVDTVRNFITPVLLTVHFLPFWSLARVRHVYAKEDSRIRDLAIDKLFTFLREVGGALLSHEIVDKMLDLLVWTIRDTIEATGCVALLLDDFNENLEVRAFLGSYPLLSESFHTSIPLENSAFEGALKEREPIFYSGLTGSQRTQIYGNDPSVQDVNSLIIIPLVVEDRAFGIISLVKSGQGSRFSEENFNHANILTRYASLIIENRHNYLQMLEKRQIEREVDIASGIQESLIPQRIPQHQYIEVATFTKPLKGVSGDYFDVITHEKEGRVSVLICDVAGKGIPASLLMVMIRTAFHLIMERGISEEGEVVSEINRLVEHTTAVDLFATLSLYTYVPSRKCITYSSGGHLPMIVYREKEGKVEHFEALGLPIGIDGSFQYQTQEIAVGEGDYVVLYTDGIVETRNEENEEYGIERLSEGICEKAKDTAAAKELLEGLIQDLSTFQDEKETTDDRTLIAARVRSKAAS